MSLMNRLTCGFEELSLSVLEIWGNVKGGDGGGRPLEFLYAENN